MQSIIGILFILGGIGCIIFFSVQVGVQMKENEPFLLLKALEHNYPVNVLVLSAGIALLLSGIASFLIPADTSIISILFWLSLLLAGVMLVTIIVGITAQAKEQLMGRFSLLLFISILASSVFFILSFVGNVKRGFWMWLGFWLYLGVVFLTTGAIVMGI